MKFGLKIFSLLATAALTFVLFYVWLIAFLRGGIAWVDVNAFGEAYPELIMWIVVIPIVIIGTYYNYKEMTL